jgi:hypothetical protein
LTIKRRAANEVKKKQAKRKERTPRAGAAHKSRLTEPEAETLFVIWQSNRQISNADIAEEHFKYFRPDDKKSEATIRGTINRIKKTEVMLGRRYIISSEQSPHVHEIAAKECVHSQGTAIMLLELKKGYLEWGDSLKEILRKRFEQYLHQRYPSKSSDLFKGPKDIAQRVKLAEAKGFAKFKKYGTHPGVEPASRLDFDLPYLLLIAEDYSRDLKRGAAKSSAQDLRTNVHNLVSLFGQTAASKISQK